MKCPPLREPAGVDEVRVVFETLQHGGPLVVVGEARERLDVVAVPQSVFVHVDRVLERHLRLLLPRLSRFVVGDEL